MMDAKLKNTEVVGGELTLWDFATVDATTLDPLAPALSVVVPIIYGAQEAGQQATACAFTNKGSVMQLPDFGVQWTNCLTGDTPFLTIDSEISSNLFNNGLGDYVQQYSVKNDRLYIGLEKRRMKGGF